MSDKADPFWFLDVGRLPRPLQWWVLFSFLPSIWAVSYLPDHPDLLATSPWAFVVFVRLCEVTSGAAFAASMIHTDLSGNRRRGRQ